MPPAENNKSIKDFFKPFTIPKSRLPRNDIVEDEIVVAARPRSLSPPARSTSTLQPDRGITSDPTPQPIGPTGLKNSLALRESSVSPKKPGQPRKDSPQVSYGSTHTNSQSPHPSSSDDALSHLEGTSDMPYMHPPPPPAAKYESYGQSITTSFSSVSTLSSVPLSSQSSSKRIIKNGLKAVTNSDSGSEDSSSDELADISTFVARKRRKLTPPREVTEPVTNALSTVKPNRQSARVTNERKRSNTPRRSPSPPRTVYKHSLANMIKQRKKEEKTELKIQEAEAAFEEAAKKREQDLMVQGLDGALEAAVADDSDQGERMKLALARTEALQDEQKFHFFRRASIRYGGYDVKGWGRTRFSEYLEDSEAREEACTSGFIAQSAEVQRFPVDLRTWIAHQLTKETRPNLCAAYLEILRVNALLAPPLTFQLSGFYDLIDDFDSIENAHESSNRPQDPSLPPPPLELDGPPPGLENVLDVIVDSCLTPASGLTNAAKSLADLIIAGLDSFVRQDPNLLGKLYDTISQILDGYPASDLNQLYKRVVEGFRSRQLPLNLRYRAISSLPASSTRCHGFRRLLAAHLVAGVDGSNDCIPDLHSPQWNERILSRLQSGLEFAVTETADYSNLTALVSVLDIAIDAGFSNHGFRTVSGQPTKSTGYFARPALASTEEMAFNAHIDAFTTQLRLMSGRIRDAGTTHLKRTEAKMAIDRLVLRLEYCVRTKPKKRKQMFDDDAGQQLLGGFLKQIGMDKSADTDGEEGDCAAVVPAEMLSDRMVGASVQTDGATTGGAVIDTAIGARFLLSPGEARESP